MRRSKVGYLFLLFLCIFALSCSQRDAAAPIISKTTSYVSSVKAGDFALGQLEAHYLKHGYQFGNITQEQYLENARDLLNNPIGKDVLEKIRSNGDILRYRLSTGEFAVMSRNGRIRTYFKTDYQYWIKQ